MALQENLLFGTTIRENIRYAVPDADDAAVREAARVAARRRVHRAPGAGLDTPLGERGTKLSTGQRQRLSIARAVLKDTPILVLDEPTASLDAETELRVLQNLAAWGRGRADPPRSRTASRRSAAPTGSWCSHEGRIVEAGSHAELMARGDGPTGASSSARPAAPRPHGARQAGGAS